MQLQALDQFRQDDRLCTLERCISAIAHELGNPINVIELRAQMIASGELGQEQAQRYASIIVAQVHRMTHVIRRTLSMAEWVSPRSALVDLVGVIRRSITLVSHTAKRHGAAIRFERPQNELTIEGDETQLVQLFSNMLTNACQAATGEDGVIAISIQDGVRAQEDIPQPLYACITIEDDGVGISKDALPLVFEPFYTTRHAQGGVGLGLSVAQSVARAHGGFITVESSTEHGACFKTFLPLPSN